MSRVDEILESLPAYNIAQNVIMDDVDKEEVKEVYDALLDNLDEGERAIDMSDLLKLENDFKKSVEIRAHDQRIASGSELSKGSMSKEKLKESKKIQQLAFLDYLEDFKIHDPIARNHNDKTLVTIWDGKTKTQKPQSIDAFIDYSMEGIQARDDALTHIKNKENKNNVFLKYSMPKASFHYDPHKIMQYGPSFSRENFNSNGNININKVCSGGIDFKNLQQLALDLRTPNRMVEGYSYDFKKLQTRFSFPNFLLGDMLHIDPRRKLTDPLQVLRPYAETGTDDEAELVLKLYSGSTGTADEKSWHFPYDKDIYHLPPGWVMAERADGVIMYYNIEKGFQPDFPLGSYIYIPMGKEVRDVIIRLDSGVSKKIKTDVMYAVKKYKPFDITNIPMQLHLGLIAYMANLEIVFDNNPSPTYGGNKKKKSKRTNIKKMKKTKRTKRMKRMNMKYMKKSKKNHHK